MKTQLEKEWKIITNYARKREINHDLHWQSRRYILCLLHAS